MIDTNKSQTLPSDPSDNFVPARPEDYGFSRFQLRIWHGMTFGAWRRLLKGNLRKVSAGRYGLLLSVTVLSVGNSILKWASDMIYGRQIQAIQIKPDPLFIIGHWRSGTTWLNQLLGYDENHASATALQCFTPETFLILRKLMPGSFLPSKRPMDNVSMTKDTAEEDEFSLLLGGAETPYREIAFPCGDIDGIEVSPTNMTEKETTFWRKKWLGFLKKVQFCNPNKRLVLKSPAHTLRIDEILKHFPNAKFVHLIRDPYTVILSGVKSNNAMAATQSLQTMMPSAENAMAKSLQNYVGFHKAYNACQDLIPPENLMTIRYEDLRKDTHSTISRIYTELDLGDFSKVAKHYETFLNVKKGYVNNQYDMPNDVEEMIYSQCKTYFDQYGYKCMSERKSEA